MKNLFSIIILLLVSLASNAQDLWDLERCVNYAVSTNLSLKQADIAQKSARLDEQQARNGRLPSVNGNLNFGNQFGRTIDPTTNSFSTQSTQFSQGSVNAGVTLFQGGLTHNSIAQADLTVKATEAEKRQAENDLALAVASAYLNVLFSKEQYKNADERIKSSREQLRQTKRIIALGNLPAADSLNLLAQIALDEGALVQAENAVDLAYLNLKQLLQLDPEYNMDIVVPSLESIEAATDPDNISLKSTYVKAVETQPSLRANKLRIEAAQKGIDVAKSGYYPTLSAFAQVNTTYSSQYRESDGRPTFGDPILVMIGGSTVPVSFPSTGFQEVGFFNQYSDNFGQAIGLQLSVPIYNNGRTKLGVERAKLGVIQAEVQQSLTEQQLKTDIQTAIANARAAKRQLQAARRSYEAAKIAFENTEKRYKLGAATMLEQNLAQNQKYIAENDLTNAKYDYIFKLKIIDFYRGERMKL